MAESVNGAKHYGVFEIAGTRVQGELTLDRGDTNLRLHHWEPFYPAQHNGRDIVGTLNDHRAVTLLECNIPPVTGTQMSRHGRSYFMDVFPHYVAFGEYKSGPSIGEVVFTVDDASSLFYDFDAFGWSSEPERFIGEIVESEERVLKRAVSVGSEPIIGYFTGKTRLLEAETALGTVVVYHRPEPSFGGPEGISIKNRIEIKLGFSNKRRLEQAMRSVHTMLAFFELVSGRRQNATGLRLGIGDSQTGILPVGLYWPLAPKREDGLKGRTPQPADLLLAWHPSEAVASILANWLGKHERLGEARARFSNSFSKRNRYEPDRIIGSANMFDVIPELEGATEAPLSPELEHAQRVAREAFRQLPQSFEKDSILGALGRLGKRTLRQKVRARATPVIEAIESKVPRLMDVLDLAVDCRNHFVHGSRSRIDYQSYFFETVPFLTDSLEFTFGCSDLIGSGWSLRDWAMRPSSLSHPFAVFLSNYSDSLQVLDEVPRIRPDP